MNQARVIVSQWTQVIGPWHVGVLGWAAPPCEGVTCQEFGLVWVPLEFLGLTWLCSESALWWPWGGWGQTQYSLK